ncbi:hypothetical protein EG329_002587 [Mollisiaceae sp. DMI_Dod_QoI]|nr:hypothetical protein EG329_002587 [Helotiales sp. DMI_Dod_QoI]
MLPKILADMPERESGERDLTLDTLLGPPQLSAALRLIEVVIYQCSNSLVGSSPGNNQALLWIADNVPIKSIGNLLRDESHTLQAFRFQLLLLGVQNGRESLVADLLHTDNGVKEFALRSTTLLSDAIKINNVEMTKLLLKLGHDLLRSERFGNAKRRLLRDCQQNCQSIKMAELLSKEVAIIVSKDARVRFIADSSLLSAIVRKDIAMLQFLMKAGANVNVVADEGWGSHRRLVDDTRGIEGKVTALSLAVASGQTDLLCLLLEGKVDLDVQAVCCDEFFYPDYYSEAYRSTTWQDFTGTALQAAAAKGSTEMVRMLLEKGFNINEPLQGRRGRTALQAAVLGGYTDTTRFLLEHGADVNALATNYEPGRTALLTAAESKNLTLVKLLLDFHADVNVLASHPDADTLMSVVEAARAQGGSSDIVRVLEPEATNVAKDAAKDAACFKRTQLCHAIQRGDIEAVHHLIDSGACVDTKPVEEVCWIKLPGDDDSVVGEIS